MKGVTHCKGTAVDKNDDYDDDNDNNNNNTAKRNPAHPPLPEDKQNLGQEEKHSTMMKTMMIAFTTGPQDKFSSLQILRAFLSVLSYPERQNEIATNLDREKDSERYKVANWTVFPQVYITPARGPQPPQVFVLIHTLPVTCVAIRETGHVLSDKGTKLTTCPAAIMIPQDS